MLVNGVLFIVQTLFGGNAEVWFCIAFLYPYFSAIVLSVYYTASAKGRFLSFCKRIRKNQGYDLPFLRLYFEHATQKIGKIKATAKLVTIEKNKHSFFEKTLVFVYYSIGLILCIFNAVSAVLCDSVLKSALIIVFSPFAFLLAVGISIVLYFATRRREFAMFLK